VNPVESRLVFSRATGHGKEFRLKTKHFELPVRVATSERAEWIVAEAMEAGALGLEERPQPEGGVELIIYVEQEALSGVQEVVRRCLEGSNGLGASRLVPEVDWSTQWQQGFTALEVSPRLVLRPSFVSWETRPGQRCMVIDPGQAFGTGAHASTWLALKLLDALPIASLQGRAVLDVGCGTGVLALSALALGACHAVGFDLDPLAPEAALENAALNGFAGQVIFFTGPIQALRDETSFDGILANLLRSEVVPLIPEITRCVAKGGWVIFSGLIESDLPIVEEALRGVGLKIEGRAEQRDANGDCWVALRARRQD